MNIRYRNDLYGNYMLIEIPDKEDENSYCFKMLDKNKISGVLSGKERKENGRGYWYVDISKKKSLAQEYQEKEMMLEDMIDIFQQLIPILEELKNYLLNETKAVLEPEYIFRDSEEQKLYILFLPWEREEKSLQKLAEFFLEKINHKDENGVNAAYMFYRQQSQKHFLLHHFLPILEKESILKRQKESDSNGWSEEDSKTQFLKEKYEIGMEKAIAEEGERREQRMENEEKKKTNYIVLFLAFVCLVIGFLPMMSSMIRISFLAFAVLLSVVFIMFTLKKNKDKDKEIVSETNEFSPIPKMDIGMQETVFFDSFENEECLKLQWKERGRRKQFVLKEFPCVVGKIKEDVTLCISDLSVSRIHCRFVKRENKICIMDLNSTNGTFLNGLQVKNGEVLEIEKNDEILIGKVKINVV